MRTMASFKRDWNRWSPAERGAALALMAAAMAAPLLL